MTGRGARSVQASGTASGASSSSSADVAQYPVHSSPGWQGCAAYRGEGNANLVVALPLERKVIRLRKSAKTTSDESKQPSTSSRDAEELRRARREAEFIRSVISGFLGGYVRAPEILRCDGPEIARLAEKIRPQRPENRRDKEIIEGYATKYPDYTLLPDRLSRFSTKPTYCVEIKPKQGYLCKADRLFKKCPYCLMQYYKLQKGTAKGPSSYCPFDLFSGESARMDRALTSLLHSPQNNLKIFKDGELVLDDRQPSDLERVLGDWFSGGSGQLRCYLELVRSALSRPFDRENDARIERRLRERGEVVDVRRGVDVPARLKPELVKTLLALLRSAPAEKECAPAAEQRSVDALARASVLERILRMQQLHRCGDDVVAWLAAKLAPRLSEQLIYADLLGSGPAEAAAQDEANAEINESECKRRKLSCDELPIQGLPNDITFENCIKIIENYLLFCTAKDCSILMAFQKVDSISEKQINPEDIITLSNGQSFLVAVRVLDLDMKSLSSIEKHNQRDNDVIKACIEKLKEQTDVL